MQSKEVSSKKPLRSPQSKTDLHCSLICIQNSSSLLLLLLLLLLSWVGVHWSIYNDFCNVSNILYLNSSRPLLSFIPPPPDSWFSFNRYDFCIYIHVYVLFAPYSSSCPFPYHLPVPYHL
jgi:hypothetical protein